jgi:hypothetical protein
MNVIADTCVWSMVLRHKGKPVARVRNELESLILDHRIQMIGPIRQEILSGIRNQEQFDKLQEYLDPFPDWPLETADYIEAARYCNICRSEGVQGSNTDFLICAVSARNRFSIFTTDKDFARFARHLPIFLHPISL